MEKRMMVGIPVNRWLSPKFSISLARVQNFLMAAGFTVDIHYDEGSVIHAQRNKIIKSAAKEEMDLLFIDSDMIFGADAVECLLSSSAMITGAVCYMRRFPFKPAVFIVDSVKDEFVFKGMPYSDIPTYPFLCSGIGCAFTLIKLPAIQVMLDNHDFPFNNIEMGNGDILGEDLSFMHRCNELGLSIQCDPRPEIGHITERIVGSQDCIAAMRIIAESKEKEKENGNESK